jgi:hypothetical protein
MPNALDPDEMTASHRLAEVASLLAEAILRRRVREARKPRGIKGFGENDLDGSRASSVHGVETSRCGERP